MRESHRGRSQKVIPEGECQRGPTHRISKEVQLTESPSPPQEKYDHLDISNWAVPMVSPLPQSPQDPEARDGWKLAKCGECRRGSRSHASTPSLHETYKWCRGENPPLCRPISGEGIRGKGC
jgi:hypothetical protein